MAEAVVRRTWAGIALGALIAIIGVVLAIGGVWLAALGGSWYYGVTGLLMIASGALLVSGRAAGLWLYLVIFAYTVVWALWESGLDPWALIPRLVGPAVIPSSRSAVRARRIARPSVVPGRKQVSSA